MMKTFAALLAILISACSPLGALNTVSSRGDDRAVTNIAYGALPQQTLDVYIPDTIREDAPVVVFFHGGRWSMGDKNDYRFAAHAFASQGFVAVVPDVRQYPSVRFPAFLQDAAQAVVWAKRNIARFGGDPQKIFTMGHSSGAYNAVMLAMDGRYLNEAGGGLSDLRGAIGLAGPYDFLPFTDNDVKDIFSTANGHLQDTQPITFAGGQHPPVLLLHGLDDKTVGLHNTRNLANALQKSGNTAQSKFYPGANHYDILLSLSSTFRGRTTALQDSADFIRSH